MVGIKKMIGSFGMGVGYRVSGLFLRSPQRTALVASTFWFAATISGVGCGGRTGIPRGPASRDTRGGVLDSGGAFFGEGGASF